MKIPIHLENSPLLNLVSVSGGEPISIGQFIELNKEMGSQDLADVVSALLKGESYKGGGGAEAEWTVNPIAP